MTQPSLRDFVGPDCLPGISLTLHAGLLSAAPTALVGWHSEPDESLQCKAMLLIRQHLFLTE